MGHLCADLRSAFLQCPARLRYAGYQCSCLLDGAFVKCGYEHFILSDSYINCTIFWTDRVNASDLLYLVKVKELHILAADRNGSADRADSVVLAGDRILQVGRIDADRDW